MKRKASDPIAPLLLERFEESTLATEQTLRGWFVPWLHCMLGVRETPLERFPVSLPACTRILATAWADLASQSRLRTQRLVVEALAFAFYRLEPDFEQYDNWMEPFDSTSKRAIGEAALELVESRQRSTVTPQSLLLPALGSSLSGQSMPSPICSLHDMSAETHLTFAFALAELLTGQPQTMLPWAEHSYAWLQSVVVQNMRYHQLCTVGHELVAEALRQDEGERLVPLLKSAPDAFLVDVLLHMEDAIRRAIPADEEFLTKRLARISAAVVQPLRPIRPAIQLAVRQSGVSLYPYQQGVIQWILERERMPPKAGSRFPGGIVALSPGMGKTRIAQAVCFARLPGQGPTLALVPLSVIGEWEKELLAFPDTQRPRLRVLHSDFKDMGGADRHYWALASWLADPTIDIVATTKETLFSKFQYFPDRLKGFGRVIIDEIHLLSNSKSLQYKGLSLCLASIPCRWGLTGTPYRNARDDLIAQLALLGRTATDPPTAVLAHVYQLEYGPETVSILPRSVQLVEVELDALEWDFYRQVYEYGRRLKHSGAKFHKLHAAVVRLRQAAISMDLLPQVALDEMRIAAQTEEERERTSMGFWDGVIELGKRMANAMSHFSNPVADRGAPTSIVPPARPVPFAISYRGPRDIAPDYVSSKMRRVLQTIRSITEQWPSDKMIIFSTYSTVLQKLQAFVRQEFTTWDAGMLTGDISKKDRDVLRLRFDSDPTCKALLITYGAGAAGLNLQVATHLLEIDPCFNDATLIQAEARACRVGQKRMVRIYRFIAVNTYEMKMEAIRKSKASDWRVMREEQNAAAVVPDDQDADASQDVEELLFE